MMRIDGAPTIVAAQMVFHHALDMLDRGFILGDAFQFQLGGAGTVEGLNEDAVAAYAVFAKPSREFSGHFLIDDTFLAATGTIPGWVLLASVPYALIVTAVLFGKHIDKIVADTKLGVRTLPVILGETRARTIGAWLMILFYPLVLAAVLAGWVGPWVLLAVLVAVIAGGGGMLLAEFGAALLPAAGGAAADGEPSQRGRADGAGTRFPFASEDQGVTNGLIEATLTAKPYPIKAWIAYATNLVQSLPNPPETIEAIQKLDLLVAIDTMPAEITGWADVVLPECTYLERYDDLISPGFRTPFVSLRQPVVEPMYESKDGYTIARELAKKLAAHRQEAFDGALSSNALLNQSSPPAKAGKKKK